MLNKSDMAPTAFFVRYCCVLEKIRVHQQTATSSRTNCTHVLGTKHLELCENEFSSTKSESQVRRDR